MSPGQIKRRTFAACIRISCQFDTPCVAVMSLERSRRSGMVLQSGRGLSVQPCRADDVLAGHTGQSSTASESY